MSIGKFQLWSLPPMLWGGKEEEEEEEETKINNCDASVRSDYGGGGLGLGGVSLRDVGFPLKETTRKMKNINNNKWHSIQERKKTDGDDVVLVPPNDSDSDSDSDWSIGWLEPHGPDFLTDDETDDSFAVLVPCYPLSHTHLLTTLYPPAPFSEGKNLMDQWLSSLQNF